MRRDMCFVLVSVATLLVFSGCSGPRAADDGPGNSLASEAELAAQAGQAARAFFDACSKEDWEAAREVAPFYFKDSERAKELMNWLGQVEILELGEPVRDGDAPDYPGFLIAYRIKTKSGEIRQHRIAVRNDVPGHDWVVDGGI